MGRRVVVGEDALDLEIGKFLVALVAQEQGLAAIADEDDGVMGDLNLGHGPSGVFFATAVMSKQTPIPALMFLDPSADVAR
jgi:hypothetical protein